MSLTETLSSRKLACLKLGWTEICFFPVSPSCQWIHVPVQKVEVLPHLTRGVILTEHCMTNCLGLGWYLTSEKCGHDKSDFSWCDQLSNNHDNWCRMKFFWCYELCSLHQDYFAVRKSLCFENNKKLVASAAKDATAFYVAVGPNRVPIPWVVWVAGSLSLRI